MALRSVRGLQKARGFGLIIALNPEAFSGVLRLYSVAVGSSKYIGDLSRNRKVLDNAIMGNDATEISSSSYTQWIEAAFLLMRAPTIAVKCPVCSKMSVLASWHLIDLISRTAMIDLECSICKATANFEIVVPLNSPGFFPFERMAKVAVAVQEQIVSIASRIHQHARTMPAAAFTTHPLWAEAKWRASTFQFHPTYEAPPIMGLVFENAEAGLEIFREAKRQMNQEDRFEEIRISIIEGRVPGQEQRPGYSVHICPDPEALAAHATADDFVLDASVVPFLGQWNRHYPILGNQPMLPIFKREYEKHGEFMLCPVVRRNDGKNWADNTLGIIKSLISFRNLSEIAAQDDPDAAALVLPQLITPPR